MNIDETLWTEFELSDIKFFIRKGSQYFIKLKNGETLSATAEEIERLRLAMKDVCRIRTIIQEPLHAH